MWKPSIDYSFIVYIDWNGRQSRKLHTKINRISDEAEECRINCWYKGTEPRKNTNKLTICSVYLLNECDRWTLLLVFVKKSQSSKFSICHQLSALSNAFFVSTIKLHVWNDFSEIICIVFVVYLYNKYNQLMFNKLYLCCSKHELLPFIFFQYVFSLKKYWLKLEICLCSFFVERNTLKTTKCFLSSNLNANYYLFPILRSVSAMTKKKSPNRFRRKNNWFELFDVGICDFLCDSQSVTDVGNFVAIHRFTNAPYGLLLLLS